MAIAYLGGGSKASSTSTTIPITFSPNTTTGSLLVAAFSWDNTSGQTISSVTDGSKNVWTLLPAIVDGTNRQAVQFAYSFEQAGGARTVTANLSASAGSTQGACAEYSGVLWGSPEAKVSRGPIAGTTATDNVTSGPIVTTSPGDLIIGYVMESSQPSITATAGTGFTKRQQGGKCAIEDLIQSSAGSISATWTFNLTSQYEAGVVAFNDPTTYNGFTHWTAEPPGWDSPASQPVTSPPNDTTGSGATSWTVTADDDAGLSDSVVVDEFYAEDDNAGLTDNAALAVGEVLTDDAGLTDSVFVDVNPDSFAHWIQTPPGWDSPASRPITFPPETTSRAVPATDDAGLTDAVAIDQSKVLTDDAGLTDSATEDKFLLVAATDNAGLTDAVVFDVGEVASDDAGLTDSPAFAQSPVTTDPAGLTDEAFVQLNPDSFAHWLQVPPGFESPAGQRPIAAPPDTNSLALPAEDLVGLTDSTITDQTKALEDPAGLTDSPALTVGLTAPTDSAGLTDGISIAYGPAATDDAGLTDSTQLDVIGDQDQFAHWLQLPPGFDSPAAQAQILNPLLGDATAVQGQPTPTDSAGLTDSVVFDQAYVETDSTGLTDAVVRGASASDSEGLTDSISLTLNDVVVDPAGLTDSIVPERVVADSAGLIDTTAKAYGPASSDSAGVTDSVFFSLVKVLADDPGISDAIALARSVVLPADVASLTDSFTADLIPAVVDAADHPRATLARNGATATLGGNRTRVELRENSATATTGTTRARAVITENQTGAQQ